MSNRWHHETYDNRRSAKYGGRRASEAVLLIGGAKVLNVGEHPPLHTELHSASDDCCDDLTEEHRAMRDLHVVAEFKVVCEIECLDHGNIAPCLEHHHGNRAARK